MGDLMDLLTQEKFNERSLDKWELLMKHSDGCVAENLSLCFSTVMREHPQEVLMSIYNHRDNQPTRIIEDIKFFAPELGEEEDSPNAYPSLASLRQEIANLPDAAARDYLTKLFEL